VAEAEKMGLSDTAPVRSRLRFLSWWLAVALAFGFLHFVYRWLEAVANRHNESFAAPLINELTGAFGGALLFLPLYVMIERRPLFEHGRFVARRLLLYVVALFVFAIASTSWMWATRSIIYPLAGLGNYDYGRMPIRYVMEFPLQLLGFCIIVGAVSIVQRLREARERELSATRAQLQSLRLQLQPHFLFNALNTVSSTMYDDPAAADEMLSRLADLLRASLRTAQSDEVPLATELETVDCYLAIMRARFGPRLDVRIDVDPAVRQCAVPSMILQPLVENAVRHGNAERSGRGTIEIHAAAEGDQLAIDIIDDGSGPTEVQHGVGLSTTVERLRILYGDKQRFEARPTARGFTVSLRIPRRA
jgi:two-component system LytT family sensor kinase